MSNSEYPSQTSRYRSSTREVDVGLPFEDGAFDTELHVRGMGQGVRLKI